MGSSTKNHEYHLVDPSPWPLAGAGSAFTALLGTVLAMHGHGFGKLLIFLGTAGVIGVMYAWWRDVVKEARKDKAHTAPVQNGLRIGMALFITSEVMFFFAFFWSYFKAWLSPVIDMAGSSHLFEISGALAHLSWPPAGIETLDPWHLPFMNTLILLLSGTTVTWAHHALLHNNRRDVIRGLAFTVALGVSFTALQAYEYSHATFGFKDGVYPSNFYMATGFHGFHVLIGTIFLAVCLIRAIKGQFSKDHHLGFEFAAWYWHFVDVVWLFLFVFVYVLGA